MKKAAPISRRKGRPSAGESIRKLENLLEVARQQFSRHGYRAVTMRGVAEAADVSTRTLYNRYADKLALFRACIDAGAAAFPAPQMDLAAKPRDTLYRFAVDIVRQLSTETSMSLGILVFREGQDFPELLQAAEANQDAYLVQPLADYLRRHGLEQEGSSDRAKLFIAMAISEFQRRTTFGRPLQSRQELEDHARLATALFLGGARKSVAPGDMGQALAQSR